MGGGRRLAPREGANLCRGFAALLLAAPLFATPAAAQQLTGVYVVEGQSQSTSPHTGTARVVRVNNTFWRFAWVVGGDTTQGIGIFGTDIITVGYSSDGKPGVVNHQVQPVGSLLGQWVYCDGSEQALERLTRR